MRFHFMFLKALDYAIPYFDLLLRGKFEHLDLWFQFLRVGSSFTVLSIQIPAFVYVQMLRFI